MFGKWKRFDYPLMEPPFPVKRPEELSLEEAKREFEWFVAQASSRCDLLIRAVVAGRVRKRLLDFSPDSLVPLWKWAIPWLEEEKPSAEELQETLSEAPEWLRRADIEFGELSIGTKCLCMDIGFYLAEVFFQRYPRLEWALWIKKIGPFKRAYIDGFPGAPFVPSDLVAACAWMAIDGNRSESLLLKEYRKWESKLTF